MPTPTERRRQIKAMWRDADKEEILDRYAEACVTIDAAIQEIERLQHRLSAARVHAPHIKKVS